MTYYRDCKSLRADIMGSVVGEAEESVIDEIHRHLDTCDTCRHFRDALVEEERMLRSAFDAVSAETGPIKDRLVENLSNRPASTAKQHDTARWRFMGGHRAMKACKLVSAAASITIVIAFLWGLHSGGDGNIVFADAVAPLRHIERLAFDLSSRTRVPGLVTTRTIRVFVDHDRYRSEEWQNQEQPSVIYLEQGDDLYILNPTTREFTLRKRGRGLLGRGEVLDVLASLPDAKVERDLGEQIREGRQVRGFTTRQYAARLPYPITVWVDVQTRTLVGFTGVSEELVEGQPAIEIEVKNMRWNETQPEELFQVPSDYKPSCSSQPEGL